MQPSALTFHSSLNREVDGANTNVQWGVVMEKAARFSEAFRSLQRAATLQSGEPIPLSTCAGLQIGDCVPQLSFRHIPVRTLPFPTILELESRAPVIFTTIMDYTNIVDELKAQSPAALHPKLVLLESCAVRCCTCFATSGAPGGSIAAAVPKVDAFPSPRFLEPTFTPLNHQPITESNELPINQHDRKQVLQLYRELLSYMRSSPTRYFRFKQTLCAYAARWSALQEEGKEEKQEEEQAADQAPTPAHSIVAARGLADETKSNSPIAAGLATPHFARSSATLLVPPSSGTSVSELPPTTVGSTAGATAAAAAASTPTTVSAASVPPVAGDHAQSAPQSAPLGSSFNPQYQPLPESCFAPPSPRSKPTGRFALQPRIVKVGHESISVEMYLPEASNCMPTPNFDDSSLCQFVQAHGVLFQ